MWKTHNATEVLAFLPKDVTDDTVVQGFKKKLNKEMDEKSSEKYQLCIKYIELRSFLSPKLMPA